ncbi:hypothetical protein FF1_034329 [Malus domestica]
MATKDTCMAACSPSHTKVVYPVMRSQNSR